MESCKVGEFGKAGQSMNRILYEMECGTFIQVRKSESSERFRELNRQCYLLECGLLCVVRVINERLVENKTLVLL